MGARTFRPSPNLASGPMPQPVSKRAGAGRLCLLAGILAAYATAANVIDRLDPGTSQATIVVAYLVSVGAITLLYVALLGMSGGPLAWRPAAALVFVAHLATPTVLETDQIRY